MIPELTPTPDPLFLDFHGDQKTAGLDRPVHHPFPFQAVDRPPQLPIVLQRLVQVIPGGEQIDRAVGESVHLLDPLLGLAQLIRHVVHLGKVLFETDLPIGEGADHAEKQHDTDPSLLSMKRIGRDPFQDPRS